MEQLQNFIHNLAGRFRKENDLSDIIWALSETSNEFKNLFVSFFFDELKNEKDIFQLQREYPTGSSRPDFYFEVNNQVYVIEIKIWDMNDHFEQYSVAFPNAKKGWIANYRAQTDKDFKTKTWEEFYNYIKAVIKKGENPNLIPILRGFNNYLKSTCMLIEFQKMNLANLTSLYYFNKLTNKIIEQERTGLQVKQYTASRSFFEDRSGSYFMIKGNASDWQYPWFGIYYGENKTCILICFGRSWCKNIYEGIQKFKNINAGNSFIDLYISEDSYWFEMNDEVFSRFNHSTSFEEQEVIVKQFYIEVLDRVKDYL